MAPRMATKISAIQYLDVRWRVNKAAVCMSTLLIVLLPGAAPCSSKGKSAQDPCCAGCGGLLSTLVGGVSEVLCVKVQPFLRRIFFSAPAPTATNAPQPYHRPRKSVNSLMMRMFSPRPISDTMQYLISEAQ